MKLYKIYILLTVSFLGDAITGEMAAKLLQRYNDVVKSCFNSHQNEVAAYQCSGLLIRGIRDNNKLKFAWSVKPDDQTKNAQSFGFLRRDQFFSQFPFQYSAGFILYPTLEVPKEKNSYKMYCAFPYNAASDDRSGPHGCTRPYGDRAAISKYCDEQNITTINKWIEHYRETELNGGFSNRQCAFDMTKPTAARDFAIMSKANAFLRVNSTVAYAMKNNEVRIEAWNEYKPNKLPLQTFFYLAETMDRGLAAAKLYRDKYYALTGEKVPIVSIRLPSSTDGNIEIEDVRI